MRQTFTILLILTFASLALPARGQDPSVPAPSVSTTTPSTETSYEHKQASPGSDSLLADAQKKLAEYQSVSARVRQRVDLFGHELFGPGVYLQQSRAGRQQFRFDLSLQLKGRKRTVSQTSDGGTLWLYASDGSTASLRQVDLDRLEIALRDRPKKPASLSQPIALGGLPRLLSDLEANFKFELLGQTKLANVPVWVLRGRWTDQALRKMLPRKKGEAGKVTSPPDLTQLASHVPHEVRLYFGRDDLFLYRVQYRRLDDPTETDTTANKTAGQGAPPGKTLVDLELFEVQFNTEIDERRFGKPDDIEAEEYTEAFLNELSPKPKEAKKKAK